MKKRWIEASVILIAVFCVEIIACNIPILKNLYWKGFISVTTLNESMIMGDYHSVSEYEFVGMIVFVIYIFFLTGNDAGQRITRYGDRRQYAKYVIKQGFQEAVIFSTIHEMISIVFLNIFGDIRILTAHGWIYGIIFQIIVNILFYMQIYMICKIMELRISEENTQILVIAGYTILHVIYQETYYKTSLWMLGRDLTMLQNICGSHYTLAQSMIGITKFLLILIVLIMIFLRIQQQKEWFGDEKE